VTTRNRTLHHLQNDLNTFIDDDEWASDQLVSALLTTMERHAADVVLGPPSGILSDSVRHYSAAPTGL
jgi:hypothetical protein